MRDNSSRLWLGLVTAKHAKAVVHPFDLRVARASLGYDPNHSPLKAGILNAILGEVATRRGMDKQQLIRDLFT
jgi:hypothetical protein